MTTKITKTTSLQPQGTEQLFSFYIIEDTPIGWLRLPPNIQRLNMQEAEYAIKTMRRVGVDAVVLITDTRRQLTREEFYRMTPCWMREYLTWLPLNHPKLYGWVGTWHTLDKLKTKIEQITNQLTVIK